jgi:His/Glu/Gln/Arg/opine family amino acid ABC transporter permease subunit
LSGFASSLTAFGPRLVDATLLTLWLFVVTTLFSTLIGLALAVLASLSPRGVGWPLAAYSWFMRGVPELVVLLAAYLLLPYAGFDPGPVGAAIIGFVAISSAYEAEIFRAGLAAVPAGQHEAARALGMPLAVRLRRIVLPQALPIVAGPWLTYATGAVKRISIASAVAVSEIMHVTKQAISVTNRPFEFILIAVFLYGGMASLLMAAEAALARRRLRLVGAPG